MIVNLSTVKLKNNNKKKKSEEDIILALKLINKQEEVTPRTD